NVVAPHLARPPPRARAGAPDPLPEPGPRPHRLHPGPSPRPRTASPSAGPGPISRRTPGPGAGGIPPAGGVWAPNAARGVPDRGKSGLFSAGSTTRRKSAGDLSGDTLDFRGLATAQLGLPPFLATLKPVRNSAERGEKTARNMAPTPASA